MQVFISHAQADKLLAKRVADTLRASGLRVWLDEEQILPGDNWGDQVGQALRESDAMVVLVTPNSTSSSYLKHELGYALGNEGYKGRVVTVLAGSPKELAASDFPWILKRFPTVHLGETDNEPEALKGIARELLTVGDPS
jgi:hypothetical protein